MFETVALCACLIDLLLIAHLGLVPGFRLCPTAVGNVLILGLDLGDDAVQVQAAVVVHGQDHRGLRDLSLKLSQLL